MIKYTYTRNILSATLMLSGLSMIHAQDAPKATEKKAVTITADELASRKASIPVIEERIKDREEQLAFLIEDIKRVSKSVETRIDKIVNTLSKMKDSQNSKIRVAHMKEKTMKGLYGTIENYNRRRAELKEQLRTGKASIGTEAATKGIELFDAKIEKRAAQLVELSKSFTTHVDYKKYIDGNGNSGRYGHSRSNGWGWDNSQVNEKWKQNRRETTFTDGQRKKMIAAIKESIDDLETRNNTLRNKSREKSVSKETKKFYLEDIARNDTAIATRRTQLEDLMQPGSKANTTSVDRNQAHDTELMIREIAKDLSRSTNENTRNYNELKQRLTKLNQIKLNLEARKAWIKKYEASETK